MSELDTKAEKKLLFGKADRAYCENLLARFSAEVATQLASVASEVENSKAASRYELQTALQAAMGQIMDIQTADSAAANRASSAGSHIGSSHSPSRLTSRPGSAAGSRPTSATSARSTARRANAAGNTIIPAGMISVEAPSVGPLTVRMLADGRPPSGGHSRNPHAKLKGSASLGQLPESIFGEHAQGGSYSSGQAMMEQREVMHTISESLASASTAAPPHHLDSQRDAFLPNRPTSQPSPGEQELLMQRPSSGSSRAIKKTISASGLLAHG